MDASIESVTADGDFVWTPEDRAFAAIRPLRIREWLIPPIVVFVLGTAVVVGLPLLALGHGWILQPSGWAAVVAGAIADAWSVVLLVWGYRAYASEELTVSEMNIRVRATCITSLGIVAFVVGVGGGGWPFVVFGGVVGGTIGWYQRYVMNPDFPRDFRDRLDHTYLCCVLAIGIALAATAAAFIGIGLLVPNIPTNLTSFYVGSGCVDCPLGIGILIWATLALRRAARRSPLEATTETPKS